MENFDYEEVKKSGKWVYVVLYLIYILAVGFAEFMFLGLLRNIFEGWNPFFVALAAVGAVATGLFAIVLPAAKDRWVSGDAMEYTAWGFWALEMAVLALNTLLAFDVVNATADSWVAWWRHISPASPLITAVAIGVLMNMHPASARRRGIMKFFGRFDEKLRNQVMAKLDSDETRNYIATQANRIVDQSLERQFGMMIDPTHKPAKNGKPDDVRVFNAENEAHLEHSPGREPRK